MTRIAFEDHICELCAGTDSPCSLRMACAYCKEFEDECSCVDVKFDWTTPNGTLVGKLAAYDKAEEWCALLAAAPPF